MFTLACNFWKLLCKNIRCLFTGQHVYCFMASANANANANANAACMQRQHILQEFELILLVTFRTTPQYAELRYHLIVHADRNIVTVRISIIRKLFYSALVDRSNE